MSKRDWRRAGRNARGYEEALPRVEEWRPGKAAGPVRRPWLGEATDPRCEGWVDLAYGQRIDWGRRGDGRRPLPL